MLPPQGRSLPVPSRFANFQNRAHQGISKVPYFGVPAVPKYDGNHPRRAGRYRYCSCATARALMSRVAASPGVLQHVAPRNPRTEPMGATSPLAGTPSWSPRSPRSTSSFRGSRRIHSARSAVDEVSGRAPLQRAGSGFARRCGRRSLPPCLVPCVRRAPRRPSSCSLLSAVCSRRRLCRSCPPYRS
jgi:hypothetical protein